MTDLLAALLTDDFATAVGPVPPQVAFRRRLLAQPEVRAVMKAVRHRQITDSEFRAFVEAAATPIVPGVRHDADLALAALAVAVETCPQDFAEEYLLTLVRMKRFPEFSWATGVATECLKARFERPLTMTKSYRFPGPPPLTPDRPPMRLRAYYRAGRKKSCCRAVPYDYKIEAARA